MLSLRQLNHGDITREQSERGHRAEQGRFESNDSTLAKFSGTNIGFIYARK